jgi:hypothetical protein
MDCACGKPIEHIRIKLCSDCYKLKRKDAWQKAHEVRTLEPSYLTKRRKTSSASVKAWRKKTTKPRICACGQVAMKQSIHCLCQVCSIANRKSKKVKYQSNRKKVHLQTKIRENIKSRLKHFLKGTKSYSVVKYLGCSIPDYLVYLESKFYARNNGELMSWDNYGQWHIDHVIPLSTDHNNAELHNYLNTQPLWKEEHFVKTGEENGLQMSSKT